MHFKELDSIMRVYEESSDQCVLPNMYMVARLDGNGFSKLTKNLGFKKPFDEKFDNYMTRTVSYLMTETGFTFIYGYHQSDEISLLFSLDENTFGRKLRKLNSILAGKCSAYLTHQLGHVVGFDCRISQLPTKELVQDYFSWRQEDAIRNALYSYCFWYLVQEKGFSNKKATSFLHGANVRFKNELLIKEFNTNFNDVLDWTKKGTGIYFVDYLKEGFNPKTQKKTKVKRRKLNCNKELPKGQEYRLFINDVIEDIVDA